jgi:hypothetical protein
MQCNEQFPTCGNVEQQTFIVGKLCHCRGKKRLGCINHALFAKRCDCFVAAGTQMLFVINEHRRPKLLRNVKKRASANAHHSIGADNGCVWQ